MLGRMSGLPRRRLIDQLGASPCFVPAGARITGDIETPGPLVVCGAVRGDANIGGTLNMTAGSQWEGEIHARAAVIAGRIQGRLHVAGKLELGATAVVQADVVAGSLAIARGAVIEGELVVTSGEPVTRFEEKRHPG